MTTALSFLLMTLALAGLDALSDARRIAAQQPISHWRGAALRLAPALLIVLWGNHWRVNGHLLPLATLWCALFWLAFDACLNLLRGLPLDYVSGSNFHDRLLTGLQPAERWWLKFSFLLYSVLLVWLT